MALRDELIGPGTRRVLPQARNYPFNLLDVQLAQQTTGAGTTFLRWRNLDRSAMGVALWELLLDRPATPAALIADLYAIGAAAHRPEHADQPDPQHCPPCPGMRQQDGPWPRRLTCGAPHGHDASIPTTPKESP
jgi:hypothetical protein